MKRLLIISPYFAPSNAADMQRIRTSLPYYKEFGWEAELVVVDPKHSEMFKDELLLETIPPDIKIHTVTAVSKKVTSKFGLGSLALRSMWHYRQKVNQLLKKQPYDLIYFSTTQFPICILGAYWKKKFGVPYVIDMQDPWHSEYYRDKPKSQQPPKYWFSYRLNKYLEPLAMNKVDGLISVSEYYISDLKNRYKALQNVPAAVITFGAFEPDFETAKKSEGDFKQLLKPGFINTVYIGRGGMDMHKAVAPVFAALKKGLTDDPGLFNKIRLYFIGTSYAPAGTGTPTIMPLAVKFGVEANLEEITDRISYYHTLSTLRAADALFIPGSDDPKYTASKIYPYLLAKKPLLAVFNKQSSVMKVMKDCTRNAVVLSFDDDERELTEIIYKQLLNWAKGIFIPTELTREFEQYSARNLTARQSELFELAIKHHEATHTNA